jgi:formamidopyrimidine-DNA glycosylase
MPATGTTKDLPPELAALMDCARITGVGPGVVAREGLAVVRERFTTAARACSAAPGTSASNTITNPPASQPTTSVRNIRISRDNEGLVPELPDVTVYLEALEARVLSHTLEKFRLSSPFVLRTVEPAPSDLAGKKVTSLRRLGKRIVLGLEDDLFVVIHLMIAGRFKWLPKGAKVPGKIGLAAFDFDNGTLVLTEAGSKRRASIHLVRGEAGLREHDRGGLEPLTMSLAEFTEAMRRERHTLKRTLTDPETFSGIGNAYSDEILHRARLSPVQMSTNLDDEELHRLWRATIDVLEEWIVRLRTEAGTKFPEKVTAFRPEMAVHGRYNLPCPDCGTPVQRIVYAENETNYCARCQTNGKLLADRALSRLLNVDWPKSIDEL